MNVPVSDPNPIFNARSKSESHRKPLRMLINILSKIGAANIKRMLVAFLSN